MEIIVETEKLKKYLNAIQTICQKKTVSEFTQSTLIEIENNQIIIKATDIEVFVEMELDIISLKRNSKVNKILINARILFDIIKEIDEETIKIIFHERKCEIIGTKSKSELNVLETENFPEIELKTENIFNIKNKDIIEAITYTTPLSNSTLQRGGVSCILFEIEKDAFKVTATDSHCLAHLSINQNLHMIKNNIRFLLSKKAAADIKRIIETMAEQGEELFIGKSRETMVFSNEKISIAIKSLNEKFPDYKKVIQITNQNEITCNRNEFIKIVKRLSLFTENKFIAAKLNFQSLSNSMSFEIENNFIGRIHEEINTKTVKSEGMGLQLLIHVFPPYLLKAANELNLCEELTIKINGKQRPIIFENKKKENHLIYVVMPMSEI